MKKIIWVFVILAGLFLASSLVALMIENPHFDFSSDLFSPVSGGSVNVAIIPIYGEISNSPSGLGLLSTEGTSPEKIKLYINRVKNDDSIKAVIFDINSPGGAVVPSQEIAAMVRDLNKTKYAVISDVGASGAYWIASSCDKIFANPLSVTGSIGVIGSYLDFSELFSKYGITYNSLIAGSLKDIGSPYKDLSEGEREILQKKLNIIHAVFVSEVAYNRNMSFESVAELATGEFFLGVEALQLGLIDGFGNKEGALEEIKKEFNATNVNIVEFKEQKSFIESLAGISSYYIGKGIGASLTEKAASVRNDVDLKV